MTNAANNEWISAIAAKAKVLPTQVEHVLAAKRIRPAPLVASPRRLLVRRLVFAGHKTGEFEGPFKFVWQNLSAGVWGVVTEANLRGKTSVMEVMRWLLRGRPSSNLQDDVRSWISEASLDFCLDDIHYAVKIRTVNGLRGQLLRVDEVADRVLADFKGEGDFEAVMADFFMREFALEAVTRWSGKGEEEGKAVVHGWPSLSSAMFIGTDYSALLGDIPAHASLTAPLMQMYMGLPWISTLTAAKSVQQGLRRETDAAERRRRTERAQRATRREALQREIVVKRAELEATQSDEAVRNELSALSTELLAAKRLERELRGQVEQDERAVTQAAALYATERQELQAHLDAVAAGAVFRMLEPGCCPRCDAEVTEARRRRERSTHECSVCGEQVNHSMEDDSIRHSLENAVRAAKAGLDKLQRRLGPGQIRHEQVRLDIERIEKRSTELFELLQKFGQRRILETELSVLEGRLAEAGMDDPMVPSRDDADIRIIDAVVDVTDARVKAVQEGFLRAVSDQIAKYARRFGMEALTSVELRGNAHLPVTKGGQQTSYSRLTPGEKLRLKVATILALISVGERSGVGRYPGLLFIDSPGAQEVAPNDLFQLLSGLREISQELQGVQIFLAARSSPEFRACLSPENTLAATGAAYLW